MNKHCVYFHINNLVVFYVGIGNYKRPYSKRSRSQFWKNVVKKYGYTIDIIHTELTFEEACELEVYYINLFGRLDTGTGTLVNLTDGGDGSIGYKHSDESRNKIRESWTKYRGFELPENAEEYKREYQKHYTRKYRENAEVKIKYRKYTRDKYHNMSDSEKEEHKIKKKTYRDSLSDEQKEKNKEYHRKYKKAMSAEQKEKQRKRNKENMRKKRLEKKLPPFILNSTS